MVRSPLISQQENAFNSDVLEGKETREAIQRVADNMDQVKR